jgi:diguanylate cyclase (GGDEF)-like protein
LATRWRDEGRLLEGPVEQDFERAAIVYTTTIARRIAGEPQDGVEPGREPWLVFGELAAQRALPLTEVIERCLHWHEAAQETVRAIASGLDAPAEVYAEAVKFLQDSLGMTLVQMGEAFESEQRRSDEQRTRHEAQLAFAATHDALTKLPNRALILDRLEQMLARCRRGGCQVAALFIDLDKFKRVNDTLGHHAGDELLGKVAGRLARVARDQDTLGRLGGDEFVLLVGELSGNEDPQPIAERVLDALSVPFDLGDTRAQVRVTASIGIETGRTVSPAELLRGADVAMYRAKSTGGNSSFMFPSRRPPDEPTRSKPRRPNGRLQMLFSIGACKLEAMLTRRAPEPARRTTGT